MHYPGQGVSLDVGPVLPLVLLGVVVTIAAVVMARYFRGLARRERELADFAIQRGLSYVRGSTPTAGADVTIGPFATPWDEAFFTRLGLRILGTERGLTTLHLMQGTWQGKQWEVFDRSAVVRSDAPIVSVDRIATTLVVLDAGVSIPEFVLRPSEGGLIEWMARPSLDGADTRFVVEATDPAWAERMLTPELVQPLAVAAAGPLGRRWRLLTASPRLAFWFDGTASVAQIAAAMDVLAYLDDRLRA